MADITIPVLGWLAEHLEREGRHDLVDAGKATVDATELEANIQRSIIYFPHYDEQQRRDWAAFHILAKKKISAPERMTMRPETASGVQRVAESTEGIAREFRALKGAFDGQAQSIQSLGQATANIGHDTVLAIGGVGTELKAAVNGAAASLSSDIHREIGGVVFAMEAQEMRSRKDWLFLWMWRIAVLIALSVLAVRAVKAEPTPDPQIAENVINGLKAQPFLFMPPVLAQFGVTASHTQFLVGTTWTNVSASDPFPVTCNNCGGGAGGNVNLTGINGVAPGMSNPLYVNVTNGGSGGTSSSFGAAFPSAGTAAGFIDSGGNMAGGNLDASGNLKTFLENSTLAVTQSGGWSFSFTAPQHVILDSGTVTGITNPVAVTGTFWQTTQPISVADGSNVTLGAKADAKSTATDTTAISAMQVFKEISFMEQNPASRAVTNAGTFATQSATNADTTQGGTAAPSKSFTVGGKTNDGTPQYQDLPLATGGRSVVVEGFSGGQAVAVTGSVTAVCSIACEVSPTTAANTVSNPFFNVLADNAGHAQTFNSTTTTSKFASDSNIISILGTAPTTAGFIDIKGADGNVFVRQTTGTNLHTVTDATSVTTATLNAETTKVIGTVRNLGNAGGIFDTTQNAAVPANALSMGCNFTTSPASVTSGNQGALQCNSKGEALAQLTDGTTNVAVIAGTTALKTDMSSVAGTATTTAASGTQLVGISDGTGVKFVGDPCQVNAQTSVAINQAAAGPTTIISGVSAKKTYICSINLVSATAQNINIVAGTGTNCATTVHIGFFGGTTAATGWNMVANEGIALAGGGFHIAGGTETAADNICYISSSTGQASGTVTYVQQ